MEKYIMFLDQKNQYSENEYITQSNLKIQCNLYQATNSLSKKAKLNIGKLQDIKLMHRNPLHSYTLTMRKQKEKLRKQAHSPLQQKE